MVGVPTNLNIYKKKEVETKVSTSMLFPSAYSKMCSKNQTRQRPFKNVARWIRTMLRLVTPFFLTLTVFVSLGIGLYARRFGSKRLLFPFPFKK